MRKRIVRASERPRPHGGRGGGDDDDDNERQAGEPGPSDGRAQQGGARHEGLTPPRAGAGGRQLDAPSTRGAEGRRGN